MWDFINELMHLNELVPDKTILNYDQVFVIYSKLLELNQVFRETVQIAILKNEIQKENIPIIE